MPISGSFVRADWSGRVQLFVGTADKLMTDSGSVVKYGAIYDRLIDSGSVTCSFYRNRAEAESGVQGAIQGIAFNNPSSIDSSGTFGRHMQVGVNKQTSDGSPTSPCLQLDYPGNMWRFRWVVRPGSRQISVLAKQNSTGSSYRPSLVVKANSTLGINSDLSAAAPASGDWVKIGPISFTTTGSDVVWVELHNNNYATKNSNSEIMKNPAYFDHIFVI